MAIRGNRETGYAYSFLIYLKELYLYKYIIAILINYFFKLINVQFAL